MNTYNKNHMRALNINEMAYPQSFDLEYFRSLPSFKKRIAYCKDNLQRLGAGSSRIVYKVDDEKVLKLAKNNKGIEQNLTEDDGYFAMLLIAPIVYDCDENGQWIEMELCRPAKEADFERLLGVNFKDYCEYVQNYSGSISRDVKVDPKKDYIDESINPKSHEWFMDLASYIGDFITTYVGDILRISSWGISYQSGVEKLVLIDFGYNEGVSKLYH